MLLALSMLVIAASVVRAGAETGSIVRYDLSIADQESGLVTISMTVQRSEAGPLDVLLSRWRPGLYEFIDPWQDVQHIRAVGSAGQALAVEFVAPSRWRVAAEDSATVEVSYELGSDLLPRRTRHIDGTHLFFSCAPTFLYAEGMRDHSIELEVHVPPTWQVATALRSGEADGTFCADDFDALVTAPIEIGRHRLLEVTVGSVNYELAIWPGDAAVGETFLADFKAVVQACQDYFGSTPFERYTFIVHTGDELFGGTEYKNSAVIQLPSDALAYGPGDALMRYTVQDVICHELIHNWNIYQCRPRGLTGFEPQLGNHTELLWFVEGTASYLSQLILTRCGVMVPDAFLRVLASNLRRTLDSDGVASPLRVASLSVWALDEAERSSAVDRMYFKGLVAAMLIDLQLLGRTEGVASLQDVVRLLLASYPEGGPGYTRTDLVDIMNGLTESDVSEFIHQLLDRNGPLWCRDLLVRVGLEDGFDLRSFEWTEDTTMEMFGPFSVIRPMNDATSEQKAAFEQWAGIPWPEHLVCEGQ